MTFIIDSIYNSIAAMQIFDEIVLSYIYPGLSVLLMLIAALIFALVAPVVGCFFAGLDRKISARMQGRVGPPVLQPYYDVRKLFEKEKTAVNGSEGVYIKVALFFAFLAGGIFFSGGNILLSVFILTLSSLLFIVAAYCVRSPYSDVGAAREIIQVLSYEPLVLLMCVAFFLGVSKYASSAASTGLTAGMLFNVESILYIDGPLIVYLWPTFLALLLVLVVKFRKSPFDISMSHHAHQEIVRGMTTEMSGPTLGRVEILHWTENVLFMGWVAMFFIWSNPLSILLGLAVSLLVYFLMIWIDNNFARVKWKTMLLATWIFTAIACTVNLIFLMVVV